MMFFNDCIRRKKLQRGFLFHCQGLLGDATTRVAIFKFLSGVVGARPVGAFQMGVFAKVDVWIVRAARFIYGDRLK